MFVNKLKIALAALIILTLRMGIEAASLTYTIPETQRSFQDFGAPLFGFKIPETSINQGNLLATTGSTVIGNYKFYGFTGQTALSGVQLLKVSKNIDGVYDSYLFLVTNNRTTLTYLGWTNTLAAATTDLDTSFSGWIALATLLAVPSNQITEQIIIDAGIPLNIYLAQIGYMPADMSYFFAQSTGVPREMYTPLYFNKVIDALIAKPSLNLAYDFDTPINVNFSDYPVVNANNRFTIVQKIVNNWAKFSASNKVKLISPFANGDGRVQNAIATPVTSLFSLLPFNEWGLLVPLVRSIVLNPEVSEAKRSALINAYATAYSSLWYLGNSSQQVEDLKNILDSGDGIAFDKATYITKLNQVAQNTINYYVDNAQVLDAQPLLLEQAPAYMIENFSNLIPANARMLGLYTNYMQAKRAALLQSNLTTESWDELAAILRDYRLLNEPTIIKHVLDKTSARVLSKFATEKLATFFTANEYLGIDRAVAEMVRLMKKTNTYNDEKWIFPILRLYNPKVAGETDKAHLTRRGQVFGLWTLQKIFMFDIYGGMALGGMKYGTSTNYALAFQQFGRAQPMLLDIAYLRNYGNVTAGEGVLLMNWRAEEYPSIFTLTVFHEGAHATERKFKAKTPWSVLQNYWFQSGYGDIKLAVPSFYSLFNTAENHAELFAHWHNDSYSMLNSAIAAFKTGDKRILNQLMTISLNSYDGVNGMTNLKDRIRLVTIQPDGSTIGAPIPGLWQNEANGLPGNAKNGTYRFTLDGKNHYLRFIRNQITQLNIDGVLYK